VTARRILDVDAALARAARWVAAGERVTLVRGSFDLLDAPAARELAVVRARTGRMIVAVRDDPSAARRLGAGRPVMGAAERARVVAALRGVDAVVIADDAAALALADAVGPTAEIHDADADRDDVPDVRTRVLRLHGRF